MRLHAIVLVIFGVLVFGSQTASAGTMHFSVFGDGTFSTQDITGATSATRDLGIGGGAQVEFGLGPMAGLEIGAVYLSRKDGPSGLEDTFNYIQIPVQLRYWVGKYLSIGVGGYYAFAVGDIKNESGATATYAASGFKTGDYGLLGSVGLNFPMGGGGTSFFAEGRYAYGLDDQLATSNPNGTVKWSDIQVLVGLRFGGMK
jgi:hypothetical protein